MKKFNFKTRLQWGWFKAALFGVVIALLIAPNAGGIFGTKDKEPKNDSQKENPVMSWLGGISFGPRVMIMINGKAAALAKSREAAEEAFKAARLAYNAKGVRVLDIDVTYRDVDKKKDADAVKGMRVLSGEKLSNAILKSFDGYADSGKALAYTMRIDDYTVTVGNIEELVSILENAQSKYDVEDSFQVELNPPASRNTTMYEVGVAKKAGEASDGKGENGKEDKKGESSAVNSIAPAKVGLTGESTSEQTENKGNANSGQKDTEEKKENQSSEETKKEEGKEKGQSSEETKEAEGEKNNPSTEEENQPSKEDDGVKYVGFSEKIQVVETYVSKDQIKDKDTAYSEITTKNDEAAIYVVEPGDCLSIIAEKNNMTVDQIKELNPGIQSDENLYYDDRLNIKVPTAAVQILVEKQETYKEKYNEDVVYEDDDSMFIGETEVVQEGSQGTHIVTALVTYKDDMELEREQLDEKVEVAAVAQIVRRGTKSKPTYMYPVTNWTVTSTFGYRWGRLHAGIDVGVPTGTTVRASRAGQVVTAGWVGGYGNCVIIDHGDGVCTRYGHLSQITTSVGQYVNQGDQVALSGNTGRSTGPHLHFEIRVGGEAVDPAPYLQ